MPTINYLRSMNSVVLILALSACAGGSDDEATDPPVDDPIMEPEGTEPEGTEPEGTDPEGTDPEGTDPEGTDPEPTDPEPTAETASFAGSEYRAARAQLNNIITGNPRGTAEGVEGFYSFAIDPTVVGERPETVGVTERPCELGGKVTVDFKVESLGMGVIIKTTYDYGSCSLLKGTVIGTIVIEETQTDFTNESTTMYAVSIRGTEVNAVLNGATNTSTSGSSIFPPDCSGGFRTTTVVESTILNNSTIEDMSGVETLTHFYSSLDNTVSRNSREGCDMDYEVVNYSGTASYTLTDSDSTTLYELSKSGNVQSGDLDSSASGPIAQLDASVNIQDQPVNTLEIVATDPTGAAINVTLNDGMTISTFTEDLDFRNLSDLD